MRPEGRRWGTVQYGAVSGERELRLGAELAGIVRPGVLWWDGATVVERSTDLDAALAAAERRLREQPPAPSAAVRAMYRRVGLDPTKTRPSSEALLRRVRRGEPLPRINSMVDVVNWCSVEFQLPYGLYDRTPIRGLIELRVGREGESYPGIRKDDVRVTGRMAVADDIGPFGNPTSDSARTMVTTATGEALVVVYAPAAVSGVEVSRVLDETAARLARICGGHEAGRWQA